MNLESHIHPLEQKIRAVARLPEVSGDLRSEASICQQKLDQARIDFLARVAAIEDHFKVVAWDSIEKRWSREEIAKATPTEDNLDWRAACLFRALQAARRGKTGVGSGGEQRAHKIATVTIQHGHGLDSELREGLSMLLELAAGNWSYAAELYEKHVGAIPKR